LNSSLKEEKNEYTDKVLDHLASLAEGKRTISRYELAMDTLPNYYRKIYRILQNVPRGKVISYGGLAKAAGSGRAARAVGNAMKNNPFPLIVPCHRVIKSDRGLGGFGGGVALKEKILLKEGVLLKNGKVEWTSLVRSGELKK
jgi:methylated-DNA-[protein]-cysteine S-methyltransferase